MANKKTLPSYIECDYLVIGSGIAGLYFALNAVEHGKVIIVTKKKASDSNTWLAQGGIASVLGDDDSFESHIADTERVGAGLCDHEIVETAVKEGPKCIKDLAERFSVSFDTRTGDSSYDLGKEGGHSHRRVVHVRDLTGKEVAERLLEAAKNHPGINIYEDCMAVDLLSSAKYGGANACFGAYILDKSTNEVSTIVSRVTVMASGGAGKVYLYTSNPDVASGDGIAMAYRIGGAVANMEFIQFHPTCLFHPEARSFLISEALRGEGGKLVLESGERFMGEYHPDQELASRDVVARAIDDVLKRTGEDCVFLDMTHLDPVFLQKRFPNVYETCLSYGIDITKQPIPVVPAAHYLCGGIKTDSYGRTSVQNLLAIGEVAYTGFHGACRIASNSLLEGLVFSRRAGKVARDLGWQNPSVVASWSAAGAIDSDEAVVVSHNWDEIRRLMWNYVGIVRSTKRLQRARSRIGLIREEIKEYYWNFKINSDFLELRNLALVAHLIIASAQSRKESRGLHYMLDYKDPVESMQKDTVFVRGSGPPPL